MDGADYYYIMAFETTTDAVQAETYAKGLIQASLMPVPREISSGCGLSLRFMEKNLEKIHAFCTNTPVTGTLYKMYTAKVDGKYPIEKLNWGRSIL